MKTNSNAETWIKFIYQSYNDQDQTTHESVEKE